MSLESCYFLRDAGNIHLFTGIKNKLGTVSFLDENILHLERRRGQHSTQKPLYNTEDP